MGIKSTKRYVSVKHIPELYPAFSEAGVRWLIYNGKTNGFGDCLKRIGRKIIIDLDMFENWIEDNPCFTSQYNGIKQ